MSRKNRFLAIVALAAAAALYADADKTPPAPADLRVLWTDDGRPVTGIAGSSIEIGYVLRNQGGRDAFAVVLRALTALGPATPPTRLQPGPAAGKQFQRVLRLALAPGMRELCVEATLQNLSLEDPVDPNPADNRACRSVAVREKQ
jgi:hypothetical protein